MATKTKGRVSRKNRTAIEYELSEWDAELPKLRKRSNSVDLLDELRRASKKFHSRSQTAVARHPQHYCGEEHTVTQINNAPNTTHAVSHRYNKEAKIKLCHEWEKTNRGVATRSTQCALKGPQSHSYVQCSPPTRDMTVQTHKWRPDTFPVIEGKPAPPPPPPPPQPIGFDFDKLYAMIEARLKPSGCGGPHIPEELMHQMAASLAELLAQVQVVKQTTVVVDEKEDKTLAEIKKLKMTSGPAGVPEELIDMLERLLSQKDSLSEEILRIISKLKEEHASILNAIKNIRLPDNGLEREYYLKITTMLEEILSYLRVETVETRITRRELYGGKCRCGKIGGAVSTLLSAKTAEMPGQCQRCVNDGKGHTFLISLKLPINHSSESVNVFGRMIECIENDDDFNLQHLIREMKDLVPGQWENKHYQVTYEALFLLTLLWQNKACAYYLAGLVDVKMMLQNMAQEKHRYELPNYMRLAVETRHIPTMKRLFEKMTEVQRICVINSGAVQTNGAVICPMFEAARNGDVETFEFLIKSGASLDLKERDRSILHEIAKISYDQRESPKVKEWTKALISMLGIIYENAGFWWERQVLGEAWTGCTEGSVLNALRYLYSLVDHKGHNALQYAAKYGSPEIINRMVCSPPYEFNPDPLVYGYDNGKKGYIVDQIESRLAVRDESVLERMLLRNPPEGASVLSIEPFRTMINDKWRRYRFFYSIWFLCYVCYMVVYSACAIQRPIGATSVAELYSSNVDYGRMVGEIFVIACLPLFFYGEIRDGVRIGFVIPRPWLRTGLFRITNLIFVLCTIAVIILRFTLNPNEEIALALALLIGWLNALEFLGAWQQVGMFAIVLHKVFTTDVALKFAMVFLFALAGTSCATFVIFQRSTIQPIAELTNNTFWMTPYTLTKLGVNIFREDYSFDTVNSGFAVFLYVVFIFIFNFMLFSLVIGMFADTYTTTKKRVTSSWMWTRATYALLMDRRLPGFLCIRYNNKTYGDGLKGVSAKLMYRTTSARRLNREGKLVDYVQHVVLLTKEDDPSPVPLKLRDTEIMLSRINTPRYN